MIIGHLPSGYLFAKSLEKLGIARQVFLAIILGSVIPDIDMLWFHFVDHGAHHHHGYLTHRPFVWGMVFVIGLILKVPFGIGLGLGGILHVALDTIAGSISWGWPFVEGATTFVVVNPTHDHWLLSFLAHWTFKVELFLCLLALVVFWRSNTKGKSK